MVVGIVLNSILNMLEHVNKSLHKSATRLRLLRRVSLQYYGNTIIDLLSDGYYTSIEKKQRMLNIIENRAQRIIGENTILPSVTNKMRKMCCIQVFRTIDGSICDHSIDILSYYIRKRMNREMINC